MTNTVVAAIRRGGGGAPGETFWFAGSTVPDNTLECTGQEVLKTAYADLYTAIADLWATTGGAAAPAAGNFRLPPSVLNSNNIFAVGKISTDTVGDAKAAQNASHSHSGTTNSAGSHAHNYQYTNIRIYAPASDAIESAKDNGTSWSKTSNGAGNHTHTVTPTASGGATARPNAAVFKLCIWI